MTTGRAGGSLGLKLDKGNKFAVAIVARPARLVADKAAEVALEDAVRDVGRKLGKEERLGWLCTAHGTRSGAQRCPGVSPAE